MQNTAIENYDAAVNVLADASSIPVPHVRETDPLGSFYDPVTGTRWIYLKADAPVNLTEEVISSFWDKRAALEAEARQDLATGGALRVKFLVFSSARPGVFSLGGDLNFFKERIADGDREGLKRYAMTCIDLVHAITSGFGLPITTIALVRGTALGGGFEGALAHNVVIAEKQSQMGLPEIMFNLFPGMGAYQLLCRRLPPVQAEKLILSGKTFSAEELYEMGVVDVLAETGKGEEAVWEYIRQAQEKKNGRDALRRAIHQVDSIRYEDLTKVVDVWVDAAFSLSDSDLKTMDYLVRAQRRMSY